MRTSVKEARNDDAVSDSQFGRRRDQGRVHRSVVATLEEDTGKSAAEYFDLIDLMFHAQMEAALAQARLLVSGRLHRIDFVAPPGRFSLDDARPEKIEQLIALGRGEAIKKEHRDAVTTRFLNHTPAERFEPVHRL